MGTHREACSASLVCVQCDLLFPLHELHAAVMSLLFSLDLCVIRVLETGFLPEQLFETAASRNERERIWQDRNPRSSISTQHQTDVRMAFHCLIALARTFAFCCTSICRYLSFCSLSDRSKVDSGSTVEVVLFVLHSCLLPSFRRLVHLRLKRGSGGREVC